VLYCSKQYSALPSQFLLGLDHCLLEKKKKLLPRVFAGTIGLVRTRLDRLYLRLSAKNTVLFPMQTAEKTHVLSTFRYNTYKRENKDERKEEIKREKMLIEKT
jgi:hypothetical protein